MARIVYGICGTGHGHARRAAAVMRQFPQHEFLVVTWGDALPFIDDCHQIFVCPNPESPIVRHRVDTWGMIRTSVAVLPLAPWHLRRVQHAMTAFRADVAISDYEFFVPRASRSLGIPCLSLDHQHVVTAGSHDVPWRERPAFLATWLLVRWLHSRASSFLATSFYEPSRSGRSSIRVLPPLVRPEVLACAPREGDHAVAYQGFTTFDTFSAFVATAPRPVIAYGPWPPGRRGNATFEPFSEAAFLDALASCAYVICGGGHTLISEALFLGKPVLSFPIASQYEQVLNARYLEKLGFGAHARDRRPRARLLEEFEARVPGYRAAMNGRRFCGNDEIFAAVAYFIERGVLPSTPDPAGAS